MMLDRRLVIGLLAGCACCGGAVEAVAQGATKSTKLTRSTVKGCRVPDALAHLLTERGFKAGNTARVSHSSSADETKLVRTTGNPDMDRALDAALYKLAETFKIFPGFGFYDDGDEPNAWAMSKPLVPGTDGTVGFGQTYFKKWLEFDNSGIAILATAAHEFGHVWLFKSGLYDKVNAGQSTVKRSELHADFLCGYYMGVLKTRNPSASFWKAGEKIFQIGDFNIRSPDHHGTPEERVSSAEAGFKAAFVDKRIADDAFKIGLDYVAKT